MADAPVPVLTREFVPQDLQEKEYIKPWLDKPWDKATSAEFFKKHDGLESLLGQRPKLPDPKTAKPEEISELLTRYRPEKSEEYEIPVAEGKSIDPTFVKFIRDSFHEARMEKSQAATFLKKWVEYGTEQQKAQVQAAANKAKEFDVLAKAYLGEQNKESMERVKLALKEHAPAAAHGMLDTLPEKELLLMTACIDAIMKKYVPEADLKGKGKPPTGSGDGAANTEQAKQAEMQALMRTKAFTNFQDPEHKNTNAKVQQLSREISDIQKGKK
jgi:hypothetical protein